MTTLVLEGWSSKLNPQHSVLEQVEDTLRRHESALSTRMSRWMGGTGTGTNAGLSTSQQALVAV